MPNVSCLVSQPTLSQEPSSPSNIGTAPTADDAEEADDVEMDAEQQDAPESPAAPAASPIVTAAPPQTPRGPPSLRRQLFFRSAHKLTMEAQKSQRTVASPSPAAQPSTPSPVPSSSFATAAQEAATPSRIALPSPGGTEWEVADEDDDVEMAYETDVHAAVEDDDADEVDFEDQESEARLEVGPVLSRHCEP